MTLAKTAAHMEQAHGLRVAPSKVWRFFAILECELLNRRKFRTKAEVRMAVFQFIEGWYSPGRRRSALGYRSPISYERSARERLESVSP